MLSSTVVKYIYSPVDLILDGYVVQMPCILRTAIVDYIASTVLIETNVSKDFMELFTCSRTMDMFVCS